MGLAGRRDDSSTVVVATTNRADLSLVNRTAEGHLLHPGTVTRRVELDEGSVSAVTSGVGTGLLAEEIERQRRATLEGLPALEWVVVSPTGRFWHERNFSRSWEALRRRFRKRARKPP